METAGMSNQSRREFLQQSLFSATAAAFAGSAFSAAPLIADDKQSSSPNERLRVAVLGVRSRGQSHLGAFTSRKDTEVVAIVDPDEAVGQKLGVDRVQKKTGKKPAYYKDPRKVMDDKSIDIVTIATPNHWHSLAAIWAVQHGKDVYCEKPVSHNVSEGRRVVQAARKHKRIVQTGTQCRSNPGTIDAIKFVKSGEIGPVKLAYGLCYKRRKQIGPRGKYDVPASVDYKIWLGPAPEAPLTRPRFHYDWHWQWPYGNGDLGNQGIHQMDIARWGLGATDIGQRVVSYGGRLGYIDAGDTANTQVCIYNFGDKGRLVFEVRGLETRPYKGANVGVIFVGSKGYVVLTSYTKGAAFSPDGKLITKFSGGGDHFGNFITAVRSRKKEDLHADIEQGHLSSALCHLGNVSYRLGSEATLEAAGDRLSGDKEATETFERFTAHLRDNKLDAKKTRIRFGAKLAVDGKKEVFTGTMSEKANQYLTREYRKGFEVPTESNV
jgi:predicted dehydrogenase